MSDPLGARPPRPAPSGLLLKAAVVLPDVIISSLLWLVIIAALPTAAVFAVIVAGVVVGALLAAGLGEDAVVRVLYRARRATPAEAPRLAVAWRIATHHLDADGVRLRIASSGSPVATAGRRHVLLRRDVVDAYCANNVNAHQVAVLIAQGIGRLRHGHTRFDLLWTVWTIPWDFLRGLAHAIGRRLAWIPLVDFAWRSRFIVGSIAIVLEAQAARWPSPILIAAFVVVTYLVPNFRRAWESNLAVAADSFVGFQRQVAARDRSVSPRLGSRARLPARRPLALTTSRSSGAPPKVRASDPNARGAPAAKVRLSMRRGVPTWKGCRR